MANKYRNEFTVTVGELEHTIRPTLKMLEEKEEKFDLDDIRNVRVSRMYHLAGWILTHSNHKPDVVSATEAVWEEGLEKAREIAHTFMNTAYRVPQSDKEEAASKKPGKAKATSRS